MSMLGSAGGANDIATVMAVKNSIDILPLSNPPSLFVFFNDQIKSDTNVLVKAIDDHVQSFAPYPPPFFHAVNPGDFYER